MNQCINQDLNKDSWGSLLQTASEITEMEQPFCNICTFTICKNVIKSFHQPGSGG